MAETDPTKDEATAKGVAAVIALIVALAVAIPTLLAVLAWFIADRWARRTEWILVTAAGLAATAVVGVAGIHDYGRWLAVLATGNGSRLAVPAVTLAAWTLLLAGILGVVSHTKYGRALADAIRKRIRPDELGDREQYIPDDVARAKVDKAVDKIVAVPGAITGHDHTLAAAAGDDASFVVGVDQRGQPVRLSGNEMKTHMMLLGSTGSGKALALDTPIPTPNGWTTMGALAVGDLVFDERGQPTEVTFATDVQRDRACYEVVFDDGTTIVADADHRWLTETRSARISAARAVRLEAGRQRRPGDHRDQRHKPAQPAVVTTEEIRETLKVGDYTNHSIALAGPLQYPGAAGPLPIAPYTLGAWLGDGSSYAGKITTVDQGVLDRIKEDGYAVTRHSSPNRTPSYGIGGIHGLLADLGLRKLAAKDLTATRPTRPCNPPSEKHIPARYLQATFEERLALLQGLMDTDGEVTKSGGCVYTTTSAALADGVEELLHGLGIKVSRRVGRAILDGVDHGETYQLSYTTDLPVVTLTRKAQRQQRSPRPTTRRRYITDVRPVPSVPVRCIQVSAASHLFLAGRACVPTHNTVTITTLLGGFLDMGWSGVVIDLKEDTAPGGLADFCRTYAARHALPYQEVALSSGGSPNWFNPLLGLDPDAARDAILAMQSFEAAHYEALGKKVLGQLVTLMFDATKVDPQRFPYPDIFRIGQILGRPSIKDATREMRAEVIKALPYRTTADFESLATPDKDIESARPGLSARLTQIYNTDAGRNVLRPQHPGHRPIDVTAPGVCYIGLSSTNLPDLSKAVASATLLRMAAEAGRRTSLKRNGGALTPIMLVIDEANEVDQTKLQNILSRARSADIRTLVSTQGPKDFPDDKDTPGFSALLQNTTTQIIMSQTDPESAEICANVIGQQEYDVVTRSIREGELGDGGSLTRRTDYRVHPDQLRQLEIGEGVMNVMRPHRRLQWVKFVMRRPDQ